MKNWVPEGDDIVDLLPEILAGEDLSLLAEELNTSRENLERALVNDPTAIANLSVARAHFEELLNLRILLLAPQALVTLEAVMKGRVANSKLAMAAVRAAESALNRIPATAQVSRTQAGQRTSADHTEVVEPLHKVMQGVKEADQPAVLDRYMAMLSEMEAFRKGDVIPENVTPGETDDGEVRRRQIQAPQAEDEAG